MFSGWNIRVRLTLLYLCIFGFTLVLFSSLLYRNFINAQKNEFDIALYNHAVDIAQGINLDLYGNWIVNPDILSTGGKIFPFSAGNLYIQILSLDGSEIARSRNLGRVHLPYSHRSWPLLLQSGGIFQTLSARELQIPDNPGATRSFRLLTALAPGKLEREFILLLAVPEILLTPVAQDLRRFLWIGIPLALFLATLAGLYLSKKALAPVRDMIEKANSLSPNHLDERIPVPPAHDEIQNLALTLNALLDRLQRAFESQERFIADASHELKTPLAILKGELDVFRQRPRSSEEVSAFVESSLQELTFLSRIVEDLLILARVDAGTETAAQTAVHLEEVVFEVISKLEVLGSQKNVKVRLLLAESEITLQEDFFLLRGDSDLLRILIKNLVENAIKYSPAGQFVEVKLGGDAHWITLQVTDFGPGIPKESIQKIFERFYRGPNAGKNGAQGAGLGLAIAKKIAEIHGGTVQVDSIVGERTTFFTRIRR